MRFLVPIACALVSAACGRIDFTPVAAATSADAYTAPPDAGTCAHGVELSVVQTLPIGASPQYTATADLDDDGRADIVTGNEAEGSVSVLLAIGDGTFRTAVSYATDCPGKGPTYVAIADLDVDGRPDLIATDYCNDYTDGRINLFYGAGEGAFVPAPAFSSSVGGVGANPMYVVAVDLDGDQRLDLAVCHNNGGWPINVFLQNATGGFDPKWTYAAGQNPQQIAFLDLDHDGALDLALGTVYSGAMTFTNKHDGTGALDPAKTVIGGQRVGIVSGDFNGDGIADLMSADLSGKKVDFLAGTGSGTFAAPVSSPTLQVPDRLVAADLDLDGRTDLVYTSAAAGVVSVLLGRGDGTFAEQVPLVITLDLVGAAVAELTGDGRTDISVASTSAKAVYVVAVTCAP